MLGLMHGSVLGSATPLLAGDALGLGLGDGLGQSIADSLTYSNRQPEHRW